ncbi:MAG: AAA family ATPase [Muribaculaceae bacterium]|nr:AAA family ATPase [Muribaculaceae bacterium]
MSNIDLQHIDLDNPEFQDAWSVLTHTNRSVFLTGKAGTGKSTFLKYIRENIKKKTVVLAPTGIAAVNVGGQTMHSFFKIPFKPLLPDDPDIANITRLRKMLRYTKEKVKLIRELDLIIIDEISMVRADIIDFVDRVLRVYSGNMREPFGGKQLLLVGDIFQLEPVVTHDMRDILRRFYKNFFFFNARAFAQINLVAVELRKIYRQSDNEFISLLDRVRINRASSADIAHINQRYNPDYQEVNDNFAMTLATRRDTVDSINDEHMQALKTREYVYEGVIENDFPENSLPTAKNLVLKVGAQVIFIRNDKEGRWYNGTIGRVTRLETEQVYVTLEDGSEMHVLPEIWENMQYTYNEKEKKVEEKVLGTFMQIPIKPAWALTVHKSQGLTFNHVVIDFVGGAFTGGQAYVALSRCTSMEGITLLKPLSERDIIVNLAVVDFSRQFNNRQILNEAMEQERANQLYRRAVHAFDHQEFEDCVKYYAEAAKIKDFLQNDAVKRLISKKLNSLKRKFAEIGRLKQVIESQKKTLRSLALEYASMGDQALDLDESGVVGEGSEPYGKRLDDIAIRSALANYNKALRIVPDCVEAMIGKARLLMALDQLKAAEQELKNALVIDKDNYLAHMIMGELMETHRDMPMAIKSYKKAIKADKKRPEPHDRLQAIYEKVGLDDLAEEEQEIANRLRKALYKKTTKRKRNN